jgi:hypothetical protein
MGLLEGKPGGYTTEDIKHILKYNGFSNVLTYGGYVPIDEWTPYGNGIENKVRFSHIDWESKHIHEKKGKYENAVYGLWTFAY